MGYKVQYTRIPELIVCGSILNSNKYNNYSNYNTKIWGVGFATYNQSTLVKNPNLFYAVRGKLTVNSLNLTSIIALGDPGLLLSKFYMPITKKKYDICIVSHFGDYKYIKKNYGNKYNIINMGKNNIELIANSINRCNFIFSSSLHGIIFSHSLGIPAVHLKHKTFSKKDYKFKDYYSVLDIKYTKIELKKVNFDNIIKKYEKTRFKFLPSYKNIRQIQDSLLFYFPYQKMNNIIWTIAKNINININNWCEYHLNLGFDNIYIYDNNNKSTQYIGDFIDYKIKSKVHIFNINNQKLTKNKVEKLYIDFYNKFK